MSQLCICAALFELLVSLVKSACVAMSASFVGRWNTVVEASGACAIKQRLAFRAQGLGICLRVIGQKGWGLELFRFVFGT